jgi:hypothetical protein
LGHNTDGGYIINKKSLELCDVLYSYGIGNEFSFEIDFSKTHKPMRLYDHTINAINFNYPNYVFHKEPLSSKEQFIKQVLANNDADKKILLKMDVDFAEYLFFESLGDSINWYKNVVCMIVEFHIKQNFGEGVPIPSRCENSVKRFLNIIEYLNQFFYIIHHHGNDYFYTFCFDDGFTYPRMPEITFFNKSYSKALNKKHIKYPIPNLDYSNKKLDKPSVTEIDFT